MFKRPAIALRTLMILAVPWFGACSSEPEPSYGSPEGATDSVGAESTGMGAGSGGSATADSSSETTSSGSETTSSGSETTSSGSGVTDGVGGSGGASTNGLSESSSGGSAGAQGNNPPIDPEDGPAAGNPEGDCEVPSGAGLEDTSEPDEVVGSGTEESCTKEAFIEAVARGGVITFDCGPDPVTITLNEPAKVFNDASPRVVIDGGGLVTLSGGGQTRILYMNTCDPDQVWTTEHCDNQEFPELTVQNITFADGNSKGEPKLDDERDGGGAIWARGGRFKAVNARFFNNVCADTGPDVGGAAVRVFSQYEGLPAYVVNSTFGGADGFGNTCSNGGGISSIGVSWTIVNSLFSHNRAIGEGGNPAEAGTPGGGSGGAIYNDGQTMTLSLCGTVIEHNQVNAYGSAIFFVSNNHDGTLVVQDSIVRQNTGGGWNVLPSISMHEDTIQMLSDSVIE